jgi:hypothetical protein
MANSPADSGSVFMSYNHQDAAYLARLRVYLAPDAQWRDSPVGRHTAPARR